MKTKTLFLEIPGFTIGYKSWGTPDKPTILALHGWLDNAGSFDLLAPFLQDNFHVIAVDLPGHGLSSHLPPGYQYHFIDGIFTLNTIIQALNLEEVHLLGHSMGACLASLVAGVVPERILSLALIEALGPFSSPEITCPDQLANYIKHQSNKQERPYLSLEAAAKARAKRGYLSLEHANILCKRGVRQENNHFYWRHDRRLIMPTPLRLTELQIIACLEKIQTKTCLLVADNGFSFGEKEMQGRIKAVKNIQVLSLNGGHHLHMEKPDTVGQYLVKFFNQA